MILCDLRDLARAKKPCQSDSFYFTFSALFHKEFRIGNVKTLGRILSEYAVCEIRFMKVRDHKKILIHKKTIEKKLILV